MPTSTETPSTKAAKILAQRSSPHIVTAPEQPNWNGGYSGGTIRAGTIAEKLFGEDISGPWLTCYMLRRFGWPNSGSDDHKNLMTWCLTTPVDGFYLSVTPYLGSDHHDGRTDMMCLHFGILFTTQVGRQIDFDPGLESCFKRRNAEMLRWWHREGRHKYVFGQTKRNDPKEKLVAEFTEQDDKVWGFYERKPHHGKRMTDIAMLQKRNGFIYSTLARFREKDLKHKLPDFSKRERAMRSNPFRRKCERAIRYVLKDLLQSTHVRDLSFNIFGHLERPYSKTPHPAPKDAGYWKGAGNAPSYWYSKAAIKERSKKTKPTA